eukprot:5743403-Amphidinium_carterae.1
MNTECLPGSCVAAFLNSAEPTDEELLRECANAQRVAASTEDDDDEHVEATKGKEDAAGSIVPPDKALDEWKKLRQNVLEASATSRISLAHVPTGPTRAAYDHGKDCG